MRASFAALRLAVACAFLSTSARAEQWIETWRPAPARWFVSTRADLGYLFFRPRVSVGYGKPHVDWVGVDAIPLISGTSGGGYVGLIMSSPHFEVRSGGLYLVNFTRSVLEPRAHYDRRDIDTRIGGPAEYVALDSEAKVSFPVGSLTFRYEVQAFLLDLFQPDVYVFVDPLSLVMGEGLAIRQMFSFFFPVANIPDLSLGPAVEPSYVSSRPDAPWVVRIGFAAQFKLFDDVELRSELLPAVISPDALGRAGSHFLEFKLRWRWATP